MDTFNTENGTDTTTFTKEQLAEWAQNAAAAGAKNSQTTDSDSNSEAGSKPTRKQRKTKNKQSRGENQPKRPMSAYMLFLNENRAAIKTELLKDSEKVSVGDIAKVGGAQWKALGEPERVKFTEQAEQLKSEYAKAMETWRTEHPEEATAPKAKAPKKDKAPKKAAAPINLDEAPDSPPGFTGPFAGYLAKTVKNEAGKSSFKDFQEAITAALELGDDCGGVTRTTRGWSLRKAITVATNGPADKKEISYIKSQFVGEELAAQVGVPTETTEEKPEEKAPVPDLKKAMVLVEENAVEPGLAQAGGKTNETVGEVEEILDEHQSAMFNAEEPVYSEDEVETVSWEFKGKDYELDEKTGKVYAEDEDGEYELVGYRKIREVEVMTKRGKKMKKEVYIDEPWKN